MDALAILLTFLVVIALAYAAHLNSPPPGEG